MLVKNSRGLFRSLSSAAHKTTEILPAIFTKSQVEFEDCLETRRQRFLDDGVRGAVFTNVRRDLERNIVELKKYEFSAAQVLEFKYHSFLNSLYLILNDKEGIKNKDHKVIPIDILGTNLQLITLINRFSDYGDHKILSSFLCYQGFPLAFSANAASRGLSANNYNMHHFALGELREKTGDLQEQELFGHKLVMTLTQRSSQLLFDNKDNIGYQRISCRAEDSSLAQGAVTAKKKLDNVDEKNSSNFLRIELYSKLHLQEAAYNIAMVRSDVKEAVIKIGAEKIPAIPRSYLALSKADKISIDSKKLGW